MYFGLLAFAIREGTVSRVGNNEEPVYCLLSQACRVPSVYGVRLPVAHLKHLSTLRGTQQKLYFKCGIVGFSWTSDVQNDTVMTPGSAAAPGHVTTGGGTDPLLCTVLPVFPWGTWGWILCSEYI